MRLGGAHRRALLLALALLGPLAQAALRACAAHDGHALLRDVTASVPAAPAHTPKTTPAAPQKRLSRAYGRVDRAALRHHLLSRCAAHGVAYVPALATALDHPADAPLATVRSDGRDVVARIVTLAGGAVSAKFLNFEDHAPAVAAQTAYGVTAVVEGYEDAYDPDTMLFMDYRRTHSGMWDGTGAVLSRNMRDGEVNHPNWDGTQVRAVLQSLPRAAPVLARGTA